MKANLKANDLLIKKYVFLYYFEFNDSIYSRVQ